jgi:hypothetical protein
VQTELQKGKKQPDVEANLGGKVKPDRMCRQSVGGSKSSRLMEYKAMAEVQMIGVGKEKRVLQLGMSYWNINWAGKVNRIKCSDSQWAVPRVVDSWSRR